MLELQKAFKIAGIDAAKRKLENPFKRKRKNPSQRNLGADNPGFKMNLRNISTKVEMPEPVKKPRAKKVKKPKVEEIVERTLRPRKANISYVEEPIPNRDDFLCVLLEFSLCEFPST